MGCIRAETYVYIKICELVNIVRAAAPVGKDVHWDPVKEEFTDLPEANKLLSRPRREGWELPEV